MDGEWLLMAPQLLPAGQGSKPVLLLVQRVFFSPPFCLLMELLERKKLLGNRGKKISSLLSLDEAPHAGFGTLGVSLPLSHMAWLCPLGLGHSQGWKMPVLCFPVPPKLLWLSPGWWQWWHLDLLAPGFGAEMGLEQDWMRLLLAPQGICGLGKAPEGQEFIPASVQGQGMDQPNPVECVPSHGMG